MSYIMFSMINEKSDTNEGKGIAKNQFVESSE